MLNEAFYSPLLKNTFQIIIVCIGVSTPSKKPSPLSCQAPHLLDLQTVQVPLFKRSPLYIGFSWTLSKSAIFQWNPKTSKFFILNTILSFKSN